jgi:phage terminase small subunit
MRNARESRINRSAPQIAPGLPERPDGMIEGADAVWDALMAAIGPSGAITVADVEAARGAAESVAILHQLIAVYNATGGKAVIRNRAGEIVTNPILTAIQRAQTAALGALREIGATPSSRGQIRTTRSPSSDPFDAFLRATPEGAPA